MNNISQRIANDIAVTIQDVTGCPVDVCQDGRIVITKARGSVNAFVQEAFQAQQSNEPVAAAEGIYFPLLLDDQIPVGAVCVKGDPVVIRKYEILVKKSVSLVLRDNQIHGTYVRNPRSVMDYIMQAIITGTANGGDYIKSYLATRHLKTYKKYRIILVKYNERLNPKNITLTDQEIFGIFARTGSDLYTFQYPNEYILMLEDTIWQKYKFLFEDLARRSRSTLVIAAGQALPPYSMPKSYTSAEMAAKSIHGLAKNMITFDDLNLELITADLSENVKAQFIEKNLSTLDDKEKEVLQVYYGNNMSLKDSAEELSMHRNTLQYQLDKIHEKSGLDPRTFHDAVILYLSLILS